MAEKKREDMREKKDRRILVERGFIKFIKGIFGKKFHLSPLTP